MSRYRDALPQLDGVRLMTDGGIETTLVFHEGIDLPEFASFPLLDTDDGRRHLQKYYDTYLRLYHANHSPMLFDTVTWRANPDHGAKLGYSLDAIERVNRDAVEFAVGMRDEHEEAGVPLVISACVGPRRDGYEADGAITAQEAEEYHALQIQVFGDTQADLVTALTLTNTPEAIGIARVASRSNIPVAISFTVETDGRLPTGQPLHEAIGEVDDSTNCSPAYYMINCAHPTHFTHVFDGGDWQRRLLGFRVNASCMSHEELDSAEALDEGDPEALATECRQLLESLPHVTILGGCCGTDARHIEQIWRACLSPTV